MSTLVGSAFDRSFTEDERVQLGRGFGLGNRVETSDGKVYIYCQSAAGVTAGGAVSIDEAYLATPLDTDVAASIEEGKMVGVPTVTTATGAWSWIQVYGPSQVNVADTAAAHAKLSPTATAGRLDDGGATGSTYVDGLVLTTTATFDGLENCFLTYPRIAIIGTYV